VVSFYLSEGIPVDVMTKKSKTSLHHAAYFGSATTVSVLIKAGAYIDVESHKGEIPLHLAARAGEPEVVELLLSMGTGSQHRQMRQQHSPFFSALRWAARQRTFFLGTSTKTCEWKFFVCFTAQRPISFGVVFSVDGP